MLGRTHMAIGVLAASTLIPLVTHTPHFTLLGGVQQGVQGMPQPILQGVALVLGGLIGGLAPDLDESHSLAARKVEGITRLVVAGLALVLTIALHVPLLYIGLSGLLALLFVSNANRARRVGLCVIAAVALWVGVSAVAPFAGAVSLALWCIGAAFIRRRTSSDQQHGGRANAEPNPAHATDDEHRTFTHSLLGAALFVLAALTLLAPLHMTTAAYGVTVGYLLHLVADIPSGGVPLAWPYPKRFGVHAIKTGGAVDHLIGAAATLLFLALLIFPA